MSFIFTSPIDPNNRANHFVVRYRRKDPDHSNHYTIIKSADNVANWYYEDTPDVWVELPVIGLNPIHQGKRIKYIVNFAL